jgi:SAM-dependent methyltransferase
MVIDRLKRLRRRWRQRHKSREALLEYWRNPSDAGNAPEQYATKGAARSAFLLSLMQPYTTKDRRILELGCNVGRNLNALHDAGYGLLCGVEINEHAIAEMAQRYPGLVGAAHIINESIEEAIRPMRDGEFDVIYTMAVLEHLHSDSEWVFREMVRVAGSAVITIEDEASRTPRHFPRRYDAVFEPLGMRQVVARSCNEIDGLGPGFMARVFVKS